MTIHFVDIHCHILPGIDDGPPNWVEALAMARLAVDDGTTTIIATPHQLGGFSHNLGGEIRPLVIELRERLEAARIPLRVVAGGELRIEHGMIAAVSRGEALSLGDHRRHVLIELPHDLYLPLDSLLADFGQRNITAILAHPERNGGILREPSLIMELVDAGCLMQLTASSLAGAFGAACQQLAEWMLAENLANFIASDGHGPRSRRPLLRRAFDRASELTSEATATELCCRNPERVAQGQPVPLKRAQPTSHRRSWFRRRAAG